MAKTLKVPSIRRGLSLHLMTSGAEHNLCACVTDDKNPCGHIAYAVENMSRVRLHHQADGNCCLWIGRAAFDIRPHDVELIATTFGVRIDREGSPA